MSQFYLAWKNDEGGQSIAEILIALGITAIIISSAVGTAVVATRVNRQTERIRTAASLSQELLDSIRSVAEGDWVLLYGLLPKGQSMAYYIDSSDPSNLTFAEGSEEVVVDGVSYTRWFFIENVNRDNCGRGSIITGATTTSCLSSSSVFEDPSTQKITAITNWQQGGDETGVEAVEYLTRSFHNKTTRFTTWTDSEESGPLVRPGGDYWSVSDGIVTGESLTIQ